MAREAWHAPVYGVTKSQTHLNNKENIMYGVIKNNTTTTGRDSENKDTSYKNYY